jgi:Tol biopolymer transport system component
MPRNPHLKNTILMSLLTALLLLSLFNMCGHSTEPLKETGQDQYQKIAFDFGGEIIFHSNCDGDNEIYKLSKRGVEKLTDNSWDDEYPVWAPDKTKIAFTAKPEENYHIYTMTPQGTLITQITTSKSDDKDPSWYPDGRHIAYSQEKRKTLLFKVDIQSKKTERILPDYDKTHGIPNVSPIHQYIAFTGKRLMGWDVALYDPETKSVEFLVEGGVSCRPRFSKDGKKLAYVSGSADGKGDIWVMNPDGTDKIRLTEREKTYDYFPTWSPDGRYIAFNSSSQHDHNGDWQLYIIEVQTKKTILVFDSPGNDVFPDWL